MAQPTLKRFWVVDFSDGREIAQFDENGKQRNWLDYLDCPVETVRYVPFTTNMVKKLRTNGVLAEAAPLDIFIFEANGDKADIFTRNKLRIVSHNFCLSCKNAFDSEEADPECPRCYAKNEWYCVQCKNIDTDPIFCDSGEVRCSVCEKTPSICGLTKIEYIVEYCEELHEHFHVLKSGGKQYHIFDDRYEEVT